MEPSEIQEYRVQLAAIEGLLAEDPNNQELIDVRDQLRDIIRLATEVDVLQQPTTDMFGDDSDHEEKNSNNAKQAHVISEPDLRNDTASTNLINFKKKEELRYKDGKIIVDHNYDANSSLDDDGSDSYSSSDYSSDSENEQTLIAKEYLEQNKDQLMGNNSSGPNDSRFHQIAVWEQFTKVIKYTIFLL